jgi:membrane-anchored mycosin MYCP
VIRRGLRKGLGLLSIASAVLLLSAPAVGAVAPPEVDAQAVPPPGNPGPPQPMAQRSPCVTTGVMSGTDPGIPAPNQLALNLSEAWQHSRGEGQTVAVIDTGVQPGPRLPEVEPGGDFVETTDGLTDCDGHGTLVAGLIAGQPGDDGFSGVAPGARLISIRQTSAKFSPGVPAPNPAESRAAVDVTSLARAVVRAADLGARVINISAVTCLPANKPIDQTELGAALKYAAVQKDAVIVAAAGNNRGGLSTGSACESNPLTDPARPGDPRNWAGVTAVSIPSWWQPYVLSVGSLTPLGLPSDFTMSGPWLGIAAPGENVVSVSNAPGGGLANRLPNDRQELFPISGTSYAAAYVSGVVALVRSKFPDLTAEQVVHRITATANGAARSPSNLVGAGSVDAVAALTWDVPEETGAASVRQVATPPPPAPDDPTPRTIAFVGAGALALVALATAAISAHRRKDTAS